MQNSLPLEAHWWVEFRPLFRMSMYIIFVLPSYINFQNIVKRSLPLEVSLLAEFRALFRMSKFIFFMQPPYTNFLKYYEISFTVGGDMWRRNQKTFQEVEVYYFYAAAKYSFSKIFRKILYLWKRLGEQNSDNFSDRRSLLFFLQPQYDNFLKYYEKSFTAGSVMMRSIPNTFHNVEVYYLCSHHILIF